MFSCNDVPHYWRDVFYCVSECDLEAHEHDKNNCFMFGTDCYVSKFDSKTKEKIISWQSLNFTE
jgi:hypothetical protein